MKPYFEANDVALYHGDCIEVVPALRRKADLILTDPPFFMPAQQYAGHTGWQRSWADTSILAHWWRGVLDAIVPALNPHGHLITFCDDESYAVFFPSLYARFTNLSSLVWNKRVPGLGAAWRHAHELLIAARWTGSVWEGGAAKDVLDCAPVPTTERAHPVEKPVALLSSIIRPTSKHGAIVLDPFMGGGATIEAALSLGRQAIGVDLDERYLEVVARRLERMPRMFAAAAPQPEQATLIAPEVPA